MSNDGWVGPWRPHRPRGPVCAQHRGPGPKYALPSSVGYEQHDPSRRRAPAYTFGMRVGGPQWPLSPGPQYLVPPGLTARGRDGCPAFSMGGRGRGPRSSDTPGPAQYCPERADRVTLPTTPSAVVSSRGRSERPQQTPGPATYELPAVLGPRLVNKRSAPEYSLTGRGRSVFDHQKGTPGPSDYGTVDTDVYLARAPRVTMAGRGRARRASNTPGPSDYNPGQQDRRQGQGQTFGVRHSEFVAPVADSHL